MTQMILFAFAVCLKLSFWVIMLPELLISRCRDLGIALFYAGLMNRALVYVLGKVKKFEPRF